MHNVTKTEEPGNVPAKRSVMVFRVFLVERGAMFPVCYPTLSQLEAALDMCTMQLGHPDAEYRIRMCQTWLH